MRDIYERVIVNILFLKVKFINFFYLNNVNLDSFLVLNVFGDIKKIKVFYISNLFLIFLKFEFYLFICYCRKNVIGVDIYICGLITYFMRSWRRRIWRGLGMFIKFVWILFFIKILFLLKFGFYSFILKFVRKIYRV